MEMLRTPAVERLVEQVRTAAAARRALRIRAGGSKDFYGNPTAGELLDPRGHAGIVDYEPTELVVSVRAGTPLAELEGALAANGQMLAFEPPHFGEGATVGGCIAAGLAGPRRAAAGYASGGVRDSMLGAKLLDGRGVLLSFGGRVIKNVAGYDVSRLLAGSLGTLGVVLEASIRVVPCPAVEETHRLALTAAEGLELCCAWLGQPLPVSATAWCDGILSVRLSGAASCVAAAAKAVGGERLAPEAAAAFWQAVREQKSPLFSRPARLWRISLPGATGPLGLAGDELIEWGGALRWVASDLPANAIRERAAALGGHATLFRGRAEGVPAFTPLPGPVARINARLQALFDPQGIFNAGRMHADAPH
jgi:glycolate oxidase FAD binding subunit